mmetsp:Transcript_7367/g.10818  ORF Transcript_7367/g.10818 Transcript_7367/m.10818 type:complete len:557 (+) Transcript_7367:312-1982(+)
MDERQVPARRRAAEDRRGQGGARQCVLLHLFLITVMCTDVVANLGMKATESQRRKHTAHPSDVSVAIHHLKSNFVPTGYPDTVPVNVEILLFWSINGMFPTALYEIVFNTVNQYGTLVHSDTRVQSDVYEMDFSVHVPALEAGTYHVSLAVYDATIMLLQTSGEEENLDLLCARRIAFTVVESIDKVFSVPRRTEHSANVTKSEEPQVETMRLMSGVCMPGSDSNLRGECVRVVAMPLNSEPPQRNASAVSAMYVLNVPGEDERWQRMLRVLEESCVPGPRVHRFETVPLDDDRILEYQPPIMEHISWPQRYSNLLTHVEAWQHFATDPTAADDSWSLFFEDDIVFHPDVRGDRARVEAALAEGFALGAREGFVYLGLCAMKSSDEVKRSSASARDSHDSDFPHDSNRSDDSHGSRDWETIHGPHGTLYLHLATRTYTSYPPRSAHAEGREGGSTVHRAHGLEFTKGCGTCLHAYAVAKWRAATLWQHLHDLPWPPGHPLTWEPDALTLDVYLFHAMLRGMMPLVWNVGSNLTHPTSPQLQGMLYQDAELPGGILY